MKDYSRSLKQDVWNEQSVGRPKTINDQYLERLKELVSHSPKQFGYPFERWTAQWLRQHLIRETGVDVSNRHINRLLKQMGLSTRSRMQSKSFGITIGDLNASTLQASKHC
jgi:transposase